MIFPAYNKDAKEEIFIPTLNINSTTPSNTTSSPSISYSSFQQKSKEIFGNLLLPKESTLKTESVDCFDYWRDPNKWTKYSLEDVPMSDMMSLSQAATETRKIIEMDKLRTRLKEVLSKEGNGIATLLDEEDEVFSLQTIKEYLPPPSAEIGVPRERNVKSIMKEIDNDDNDGNDNGDGWRKGNKKVKFQLNSLSTEMSKLKLDHLTDVDNDDDILNINNNLNDGNKLNNNKNEEKNEQKFSKRQRKPKNFYNRTSTLD